MDSIVRLSALPFSTHSYDKKMFTSEPIRKATFCLESLLFLFLYLIALVKKESNAKIVWRKLLSFFSGACSAYEVAGRILKPEVHFKS